MSKLFFIGDSITTGAWDEQGGWANRLIGQIMKMTMDAKFEDNAFYCLPYNLGVSGNVIPDLLQRVDEEIRQRCDSTNPDETIQIICAIGVNDSVYMVDEERPRFTNDEFRNNVLRLLDLFRSLTDNISFIGLMPVDDDLLNPIPWAPEKAYSSEYVQNFEKIIADICVSQKVSFLPLFHTWREMSDWKEHLIDGVHPNSKGHKLLAKQVGDFLITDWFIKFHTA